MENTLTKEQAIEAMQEGKKVTHQYFSPDEWVTLTSDGLFQFEDKVVCTPEMFWQDRSGNNWETGWSLFNPSTQKQ